MARSRDKEIIGKKDDDRKFDESGFFGDGKQAHRLGCTCSTLLVFFVLLLVALVATVLFASRSASPLPQFNKITTGSGISGSAQSQIETALGSDSNEAVIVLSQDEINSALPTQMQVAIDTETMLIAGKVLGVNASAQLEPKVTEGQLEFDVQNVKVGNLPVPKIVAAPIIGQFSRSLRDLNKELAVINLGSVEKRQGALILSGKVVGR